MTATIILILLLINISHGHRHENKFHGIVNQGDRFIDKTRFIELFFQHKRDQRRLLITAPRGFSKTTNLDAVELFAGVNIDHTFARVKNKKNTVNYKLFIDHNLVVTSNRTFFREHFGRYPIIKLNLEVSETSYAGIFDAMCTKMAHLFTRYEWLYNITLAQESEDDAKKKFYLKIRNKQIDHHVDLENAIVLLTELLFDHFHEPVIFLCDEYDHPLLNILTEGDGDNDDTKLVLQLLETMLRYPAKCTATIAGVILTGVTSLITVSPTTPFHELLEYKFLDGRHFAEYNGFTSQDMDTLCERFQVEEEEKERILKFYNGYTASDGRTLCNPHSVLNYFRDRHHLMYQPQSYWARTGIFRGIKEALKHPIARSVIEKLFLNDSCIFRMRSKPRMLELRALQKMIQKQNTDASDAKAIDLDAYLTFLYENGYLTFHSGDGKYVVPNREIRLQYALLLKEYFIETYQVQQQSIDNVIHSLSDIVNQRNENLKQFEESLTHLFSMYGVFTRVDVLFPTYLLSAIMFDGSSKTNTTNPTFFHVDVQLPMNKTGKQNGTGYVDLLLTSLNQQTVLMVITKTEHSMESVLRQVEQFRYTPPSNKTNLIRTLAIEAFKEKRLVTASFGHSFVLNNGNWQIVIAKKPKKLGPTKRTTRRSVSRTEISIDTQRH